MNFQIIFLVLFITEIMVLAKMIGEIGFLMTLSLLILSGVLGSAVIRRQGIEKLTLVGPALQRGVIPADEIFEVFCFVIAGILLIIPGFITDFIALFLLVPACRTYLKNRAHNKKTANPSTIIEGEYETIDPDQNNDIITHLEEGKNDKK